MQLLVANALDQVLENVMGHVGQAAETVGLGDPSRLVTEQPTEGGGEVGNAAEGWQPSSEEDSAADHADVDSVDDSGAEDACLREEAADLADGGHLHDTSGGDGGANWRDVFAVLKSAFEEIGQASKDEPDLMLKSPTNTESGKENEDANSDGYEHRSASRNSKQDPSDDPPQGSLRKRRRHRLEKEELPEKKQKLQKPCVSSRRSAENGPAVSSSVGTEKPKASGSRKRKLSKEDKRSEAWTTGSGPLLSKDAVKAQKSDDAKLIGSKRKTPPAHGRGVRNFEDEIQMVDGRRKGEKGSPRDKSYRDKGAILIPSKVHKSEGRCNSGQSQRRSLIVIDPSPVDPESVQNTLIKSKGRMKKDAKTIQEQETDESKRKMPSDRGLKSVGKNRGVKVKEGGSSSSSCHQKRKREQKNDAVPDNDKQKPSAPVKLKNKNSMLKNISSLLDKEYKDELSRKFVTKKK